MTDKRRDPKGRFRAPHLGETVVHIIRAKNEAAARAIGLVPTQPSPSAPDTERAADGLRDRQR
jgi:hypothetical protein